MARIRTIKPEFFTSEDITSMSPLARLFYVSLWCESDREGRLEWKLGTFKLRYMPGEEGLDIESLAKELIDKGLVVLYTAGGKQFAEIPTFKEHQVINNRESESTIPPRVTHASPRVKGPSSRAKAEGKGREGKEGKEPALTRFEEFWNAWPKSERKQDKGKCAEKWKAQNLDDIAEQIMADVATKKQTQKWQSGFIEAPEVYINNKRWLDGVTPDAPPGTLRKSDVWHESLSGVKEMADKLGLKQGEFEQQPAFKARVMAAEAMKRIPA